MNIEELQLIGAIVFAVAFVAIPMFAAIKRARENAEMVDRMKIDLDITGKTFDHYKEYLVEHRGRVTVAPMSQEEIGAISFSPPMILPKGVEHRYVSTGIYNTMIGYADADGRVPESPVMIGGIVCEHCGRISSRESYYCDGCQAPIYESQAKADRIALRS